MKRSEIYKTIHSKIKAQGPCLHAQNHIWAFQITILFQNVLRKVHSIAFKNSEHCSYSFIGLCMFKNAETLP
jgi:hypothetical protein